MLVIDKYGAQPIYEQIIDGIEKEILLGIVGEGDAILSVREMSVRYGINPNTIQKAYIELERRGVIAASPGKCSYVRAGALDSIRVKAQKKLESLRELATELKLAGIDKEQLYKIIDIAYKEENADDKCG